MFTGCKNATQNILQIKYFLMKKKKKKEDNQEITVRGPSLKDVHSQGGCPADKGGRGSSDEDVRTFR